MLMMMSCETWNELFPELMGERLWITLSIGVWTVSNTELVIVVKGESVAMLTRKDEALGLL